MMSQFAVNMLLFVLGLRVYETTGSNTAVSILFLAYGIPAVAFAMIAGVVVDHLDKRSVLTISNILRGILAASLFLFPDDIIAIYVLAFLNAMVTQFYVPAEAPLIPRLVPNAFLVSANSLFTFTYFSSMAVGFILAGPLLRMFGPHLSFGVIAALFGVAAIGSFRVPVQQEKTKELSRLLRYTPFSLIARIFRELADGFRAVSKSRSLADALMLLCSTQVIIAILGTLGPGFADKVLEIDIHDASVVILAPAVLGIILGSLWVGTYGLRYNTKRMISTGVFSAGVFLILISLLLRVDTTPALHWLFNQSVIIPLAFLLFFLLGVSNSFLDVPANSTLQREADGDMRGRIYGILTAAVGGIGVLPVVAGGILADVLGVGRVLFLLGIVILVYGVVRLKNT